PLRPGYIPLGRRPPRRPEDPPCPPPPTASPSPCWNAGILPRLCGGFPDSFIRTGRHVMRRRATIGVVLCVLGSAAGCGASGLDGLVKEDLALIGEATNLLRGIKDEPSAQAALPRLEKIGDRAAELTRQAKALKLSEAEQQKVMDRHRDKLLAAADKLFVAENEARDRAPRQADRIHAVVVKLTHS